MLTVHTGAPIYVVGHSMGGAVATLCALDLLFTFQLDPGRVRLYTYGSPRVGNQAFADFVRRKVPVGAQPALHVLLPPRRPSLMLGELLGALCAHLQALQAGAAGPVLPSCCISLHALPCAARLMLCGLPGVQS